MKVNWTETSLVRIEAIEDFIAEDDPAAAARFVDQLVGEAETLRDAPDRGRRLPELPGSGLRELVYRGYRIVYRLGKHDIDILTVFEGHRRLRADELAG